MAAADSARENLRQPGGSFDGQVAKYPKPLRDFVYETFNAFADRHPWVGDGNIRSKSIAREMFEEFRSFADYVLDYDLQRAG